MAPSATDPLRGMIVDAQGVYHDISKHAFDAWSVLNPDSHKHLQSQLFKHPLAESIQMIAKKAGVVLGDLYDVDFQAVASKVAAQVGEAVTQMDQVTQQNAALVEEMAAAASSLKNQAEDLVQVVSVFRLGDDGAGRTAAGALRIQ